MTSSKSLIGAFCLALSIVPAGDTRAAPLHNMAKNAEVTGSTETAVQRIQYRLCVTEQGTRQCRNVEIFSRNQGSYLAPAAPAYGYTAAPGPYLSSPQAPAVVGPYALTGYGYLPGPAFIENYTDAYVSPDFFPAGSPAWWEAMDKSSRGGHHD